MWNEIAAVREVLYLLISEPLMNLDAKAGSYAGRQNYTTTAHFRDNSCRFGTL